MNNSLTFAAFFDSIRMESAEAYSDGLAGIEKKLNDHYYTENAEESHLVIVGSVGRGTAVDGTSDVDALYVLPHDVYVRFENYDSNGQSALLQEVRGVLKERYPKTDIKGDGQAVVVDFTDRGYTIDLVPAFLRADGAYDYPDTHDGGSWKKTDPIPEQQACASAEALSLGNYLRLCNTLRIWKDNQGFCFSGLLIDTLVNDYLNDNPGIIASSLSSYHNVLLSLFSYLAKENADNSYWFALGSNQHISDSGNGEFVSRAKDAQREIEEAKTEEDIEGAFIVLLGKRFSDCVVGGAIEAQCKKWSYRYSYSPHEEFIESKFPVAIKNRLTIECEVTQSGFRPMLLRSLWRRGIPLKRDKQLKFYIEKTDVQSPYQVYWKVRNCGEYAYKKRMVRGDIVADSGRHEKRESTSFTGNHYVECYIIKNGVCVARDHIGVPIDAGTC